MSFRFKKFKVYLDAKQYCQFCRKIIKDKVKDKALTDQLTRALNSIVLNIAEGSADNSDVEFARFLGISIRSVYETVAGCDLAKVYGMLDDKIYYEIETQAESLVKQLSAFRSSLLKR
ncbi:MAG: four helix bundle protein [Nitrospirae bacterium]|nr:four helix bundle protein [Nitrospirota bacterium]